MCDLESAYLTLNYLEILILCPCVHNPKWIICCLLCNWNMKKTRTFMSIPEYVTGELGCGLVVIWDIFCFHRHLFAVILL